jgi:hypothetical protein
MAIGTNSSDKKVISGGLWTGIANMRVSMINPTMEEMKAVGMQPQKEPEYFVESEDQNTKEKRKSYRVDFYLINLEKKFTAKKAFFIEDKVRLNKDGNKAEWINKFGVTAWTTSSINEVPSYDWFKKDGARPALVGEGQLTQFIRNWANVDQDMQASLDNPSLLAQGNVAELKALLAAIPNNEIQVLLGVKDGKYQDVYGNYYDRPYRKAYDAWRKALEKEGQEFKADYQGDLHLKPYEGNTTVSQDRPTDLSVPQGTPGVTGGYKF